MTVTFFAVAGGAILRVNLFAMRNQSLRISRLQGHGKIGKGWARRIRGGIRSRRRVCGRIGFIAVHLLIVLPAPAQKHQNRERHRRKRSCDAE